MRTNAAAVAAAVLLLAAAGCGGGDAKDAAAGALRLGVAGPLTGGQAKNGEDLLNGATLAVEEWNAKGGVLGKKVEIVKRDDEADPKNASVVAQELANAGVLGVVGHFNSGCTIPASDIYARAGIVTITPASTNPYVTDRGLATVFRVCGRDDKQGKAAADFMAGPLGARKVAIFDDKTAYGKGLADFVAKEIEGRAEIAVREGFDKGERNFRPYLQKLLDAKVDAWYFGGIYEQAAPMLIQAAQLGVKAPMMSGDGVHGYQADFIDKVGPAAEGTFTTFADLESAKLYAGFQERYGKRFQGIQPGPYAIYAYTAAQVILEGTAKAGAVDGAKIAAAIKGASFETPIGNIAFDAKGDLNVNPYVIWVIKGGKHVVHAGK